MNNRQKIVQEQFLNNEEAIIKRLKQVYNKSLADIEEKTKALQDDINRLGALADLAEDDEEKAKILSMQQSKVYQKQYQDAMKKQIGSVLDQMQVEEFKTVSDYLNKCYEEGFVGTMYDLQGQGIPLCFPMDQEAIVRAVQIDSKISQGLYSRLGEDVSMLKKKITAEVSRGISTGVSYQQIAQQLAGVSKIGFNNAVRIARTEGHRIATQSAMDACYKAKDHGADIVKQWDATLDSSTRESHSQVDMEIRELDKPFSNGLMFPGDPRGGAAEVVNCRCSLDQRARWELEGEFTKWDGFTGELKTFESQEAYDEYKKAYFSKENKQYMKYVEEMQGKYNSGNFEKVMAQMTDAEYKHFTKLQAARPTFEGMYRDQPYIKKINATKYDDFKAEYLNEAEKIKDIIREKTIEDARKYAKGILGIEQTTAYENGLNVDVANGLNEAIEKIGNNFGDLIKSGYLKGVTLLPSEYSDAYAAYQISKRTIFLNKACTMENAISKMRKDAKRNFKHGGWTTGHPMHAVYHELGHAAQHMVLDNDPIKKDKVDVLYKQVFSDIMGEGTVWSEKDPRLLELAKKAKKNGTSFYAMRNSDEFVAESIAQYFCSNKPSDITKSVVAILNGG